MRGTAKIEGLFKFKVRFKLPAVLQPSFKRMQFSASVHVKAGSSQLNMIVKYINFTFVKTSANCYHSFFYEYLLSFDTDSVNSVAFW